MPAETLAIIDGHYYAYRFFFGMPRLSGPGQRPTGVTTAFANLFKDLTAHPDITHWACVFDAPGGSFRDTAFADYKAQRSPMPEELALQLPDVEELCVATGIPTLKVVGFEADDVVATLAQQAETLGMDVRILSRDKDLDQVLSARVRTWDPGKDLLRGPDQLREEKGFGPELVIDYLCMLGDASDNVPGIKGVGEKTAVKLLEQYGSLQGVIDHVGELKGKLAENVREFIPRAALTRDLIRLRPVSELPPIATLRIDPAAPRDWAVYSKFGMNPARYAVRGMALPAGLPGPGGDVPAVLAVADAKASYRILTLADLPGWLDRLRAAGRCAVDTETTGLDPLTAELVGVSFACGIDGDGRVDARAAAYLPIRGSEGETVAWDAAKPLLKAFLEDPAVRKVGQNTKFDHRVFATLGIDVRGIDGDTMLASWLLDPGRSAHDLDHLSRSFLGEDKIPTSALINLDGQPTIDKPGSMAEVAVAKTAEYACEDAQCTWRLAELLEKQLVAHGLDRVYREQEVPVASCIARMEQRGIAIDTAVLTASQRHLEQFLESVKGSIRAVAGPDFNPASPKQIAELLFDKLKLPVISKTKSGPSTDASVLEALRHQHELPDLLLQFRMLSKLIGTYVTKLPGAMNPRTGRIHSNFRQIGTETGRLSSDQPNLQNIPKKSELGRELRAAFVAGAGRVLLAADYSQIELRVLAHLSGDATLRAAFDANRDIHRFVAAQVNGIAEDSVSPKQRNAAKAVNFGIIYGQTAFGLSQQLGISRGDAQQFITDYFARFSQVRTYIQATIDQATKLGWAQTMAGRRRYIPHLASDNRNERLHGERIALNSTIQGSAADLIKRAMLRCDELLPTDAGLILQIHDELLVESAAACADDAADALRRAMTGAWTLDVPLVADVRRGQSWLDVS